MSIGLGCDLYFATVNPKYITWEFYEPYTTIEPNFGELGLLVYMRTYSRFIPNDWANKYYQDGEDYDTLLKMCPKELQRREKWCETVLRAVEYSISLDKVTPFEELQKEAMELYDAIFNFRVFPAGRTLWIGGTKSAYSTPSSNFNCSGRVIDSVSAIAEGFYLLLLGSGFGFSLEQQYIENYPSVIFGQRLTTSFTKGRKLEHTEIWWENDDEGLDCTNCHLEPDSYWRTRLENWSEKLTIFVGDSKEGWCEALKLFLLAKTVPTIKHIEVDYGAIRPSGERLKTFGGRSSGYKALKNLFVKLHKICNEVKSPIPYKLSSLQVLDIVNCMGEAVVVGGVRRTSEIALGNVSDTPFIEAKKNLWSDPSLADKQSTRVISNNSVVLWEKPTREWFHQTMESVRTNGEPGFYSLENANKRLRRMYPNISEEGFGIIKRLVTNPCGEICLANQQTCNLTEVNLMSHVRGKFGFRYFDSYKFKRSTILATRMGSRMTTVDMFHPDWDRTQKRDRLLGVSLTGVVESFETMGWNTTIEEMLYANAHSWIREEADRYHDYLGIPRSLLTSCIKPSGTLSNLPGVSSGLHAPYAPYYLRRVRISRQDPLAQVLLDMGMEPKPENSEGEDLYGEQCKTWVFTFAVKTNARIKSIDESAIVQLERYKLCMENYVEHNVSFTCSVADHEWGLVADWLYDNYDSFVGVSFLPRFDSSNSPYPQMPYECCTEKQYEETKKMVPVLKENELLGILSQYEKAYEERDLDAGCATGMCPVR